MPEYRTPEEIQATAVHRARVRLVLDDARRDATSLMMGMRLSEPEASVEWWVDALWNGLRNRLTPEDRLLAIVLLIQDDADAAAAAMLRGLTDA